MRFLKILKFFESIKLHLILFHSSLYNSWKLVRLNEKEKRHEFKNRVFTQLLYYSRIMIHFILGALVLSSGIFSRGSLLLISNESSHFEKVNHYKLIK